MTGQPNSMKLTTRFALESFVNMALRGLTLTSKFFLLICLAKLLPPEQLGIYGLFTVTISYSLYLLGLDFYTYAHRELLSHPREVWSGIIHNQFVFYAVVYLFILPLLLIVFVAGWLPWMIIGWFYLILIFEHISQELYRLLVACDRLTHANISLFFRGGAWAYAVVALYKFKPELHNLNTIWTCWSFGAGISIIIAFVSVRITIGPGFGRAEIDWQWIRRGIKVAAQFLIGTLALRGLFSFDRYFLDIYAGKSAVGVYSFYMGFANALLSFADAGVISKLYPRIVASYRAGRYSEYKQNLKRLAIGIIVLYATITIGLYVTIQPILMYIGRAIYIDHIMTLWVLLTSIGIYCLGLVPHYALYAQGADRAILIASILSLLLFIGAAVYLTPANGATGMAFSVLIGMSGLGVMKLFFSKRTRG